MGKSELHHVDVRWEVKLSMGLVVWWRLVMINYDGSSVMIIINYNRAY
jgi:hypothetical protein